MQNFHFSAFSNFSLKIAVFPIQKSPITEIYEKYPPNGNWFLEVQDIPNDASFSVFLTTCSDLRITASKLAIFTIYFNLNIFSVILTSYFGQAQKIGKFGWMAKRSLPSLINLFEGRLVKISSKSESGHPDTPA